MLPNDATTIAALFGTWRAGGVYTPLNPRAADAELVSQLETLRPVAIITTPDFAHRFSASGLPVVTGADLTWSVTPAAHRPSNPREYDADVALLQFTSGTTGPPKPVPLRHATVLDLIDRLLAKLRGAKSATAKPNRPPMPNLVPLSLSLWAGIYQVLFAFRAGSGVVLMDRFCPCGFRRARPAAPAAFHGAAARRTDDGPARRLGHRPVAIENRPIDHRSAVARSGGPVPRQVRRARAQLVRPDRTRRRGGRDGRPPTHVSGARRNSAPSGDRCPGSTSRSPTTR